MSKATWAVLALLVALFAGMMVYGIGAGDADYVRKNAQNFCFG